MGPLNNPGVADKTEAHVAGRGLGGEVVSGGCARRQHGSDLFFEATVIDGVTEEMEIAREETFGPVVPISVIRRRGRGDRDRQRLAVRPAVGGLQADLRRGLRYAKTSGRGG